jgi:hypothetical protein
MALERESKKVARSGELDWNFKMGLEERKRGGGFASKRVRERTDRERRERANSGAHASHLHCNFAIDEPTIHNVPATNIVAKLLDVEWFGGPEFFEIFERGD